MKKTAIIAMLIISILLFSGCHTEKFMNNAPIFFPDSTWRSDDGRIEFTVDNGYPLGTINVDGETMGCLLLHLWKWKHKCVPYRDSTKSA